MKSEAMLPLRLLLGFLCVLELEDIYVQGLFVLAHIAEDNGSCLIQIWLCGMISQERDILGDASAYRPLAADRGLCMLGNICCFSRSRGSFPSI